MATPGGLRHGAPRARHCLLMPIIGGSTAIQKNNIANRMGLPKQ